MSRRVSRSALRENLIDYRDVSGTRDLLPAGCIAQIFPDFYRRSPLIESRTSKRPFNARDAITPDATVVVNLRHLIRLAKNTVDRQNLKKGRKFIKQSHASKREEEGFANVSKAEKLSDHLSRVVSTIRAIIIIPEDPLQPSA